MKLIKIDNRLQSIASLVSTCHTLADIGTDHAYLPIYLLQTNKCALAYACDVASGPLKAAIDNINKYHLNEKIIPILGDGLSKIPLVDEVIIAGMGGLLIIDILKKAPNDFQSFVLQPNNNINTLRHYLTTNNYQIIDEDVAFASGKYYEILKVAKGQQTLSALEIEYGPINIIKKSPLFILKWTEILHNYQRIINDFKGSQSEYLRLQNKISEINNIIKKS